MALLVATRSRTTLVGKLLPRLQVSYSHTYRQAPPTAKSDPELIPPCLSLEGDIPTNTAPRTLDKDRVQRKHKQDKFATMHVHIYVYIHVYIHVHIHIHVYKSPIISTVEIVKLHIVFFCNLKVKMIISSCLHDTTLPDDMIIIRSA